MAINTSCPKCDTVARYRDESEGKTVRCKNCGESYVVESRGVAAEAEPVRKPRLRRVEDEPSPKRKRKKAQAKSKNGLLIGLGIGGAVVVCAVLAVVAFVVLRPSKKADSPVTQSTGPESPPLSSTKTDPTKATVTGPGPGPVPVTTGTMLAPATTSVDIAFKTPLEQSLHSPTVLAICSHDETVKLRCDAFDSKSGRSLGGFKMGAAQSAESMALSPDGSRLVITERPDFKETVVSVWSVPDGQALIARWKPYVYKPGDILNSHLYKIVWATFLSADRLLTLTYGGRVAVWSIPDGKAIYDVQAATPEAIQRYSLDVYTKEPANFSLSHDRRLLALQQKGGVILVDTTTGRFATSLPAPQSFATTPEIGGMAFSPDGKRLAACYKVFPDKYIVVWDVALTKVEVSTRLPKDRVGYKTWSWWGDQHLLWLAGVDIIVVRADTGTAIRQGLLPLNTFVNGSLDGKLRLVEGFLEKRYLVFDPPLDHFAKEPGADDGTGSYKRLWLTSGGIEKRPANSASTVAKLPILSR